MNAQTDTARIPCPPEVIKLIKRFHDHIEEYKAGKYNETQLRQEYINPLFEALGWDMMNQAGHAEAYKDVVHEDAVKIGGATKAPDYSFRVGGTRKFFLEAKKPSVDIKMDEQPAFQLRRYAWSAKLPLSVLSDFEEFAIYDTRIEPKKNDKASAARIHYFTYKDYESKWHEIASVFSKDAVLKGSFDKYAGTAKLKKGTATVDDAFLAEIEDWRELLAKNIALRNEKLSQRELNFCVQRTIDRIIFLRICEDRGIEDYGRLQMQLNGTNVYKRLVHLFSQADDRYNSGLFHFQKEKDRHEEPDKLTTQIEIDDKPLKDIINRLYYPESPYEFSVLSADILGQVYEQFLGKVIRLTEGHHAKVEEKPEVRKAGGVYYTPKYIVDYIVKNTVGTLLNGGNKQTPLKSPLAKGGEKTRIPLLGKEGFGEVGSLTPKEASKLRILDPACGSGSFLLGAYQYLLDWHLEWYIKDDKTKWSTGKNPTIYLAKGDDWHLTTAEKKRILLNNIYGVDIDSQAVEVTKLSLLLKVLENESNQTLNTQFRLFHQRALPDLGDNIKCGNSLIGPDYYDSDLFASTMPPRGKEGRPSASSPLDKGGLKGGKDSSAAEERLRVNVFDWNAEFPEIMKAGGFDAVIGNPPYGVPFVETDLSYLMRQFIPSRKFPDSYSLFMIKALSLSRKNGMVSFIVPNTFCDLENCDDFRKWLLTEHALKEIWQTGWAFKAAVVDTLVFIATANKASASAKINIHVNDTTYSRANKEFLLNELHKVDYRNSEKDKELLKTVFTASVRLSDIATVKAGVKMYEKGKGVPPQTDATLKQRPYSVEGKCPKGWKPLYRGEDIARYYISMPKEFVDYGPWLAAPRDSALFSSPKILMRRTDDRLLSCLDADSAICVNSCHVIKLNERADGKIDYRYLLGLLNSKLLQKVFELQNPQMIGKTFAEIKVIYVERLPIHRIDYLKVEEKRRCDKVVSLVDQMLTLNRQLPVAKTDHEKTALQRQIDATDRQIDQLVYELYGLTEEEIRIVEGPMEAVR